MIFELDKKDFTKILPLYLMEEMIFPLILAVIQQKQRGWIFVDRQVHPTSAMILTNSGFVQFVGAEEFFADIIKLLESPTTYMPSYLLWYSPRFQIQKIFDEFTLEHIRCRQRMHFIFKKKVVESLVKCPKGFDVCFLDKELINKTERFKLDIGSRFWSSIDDFLEHGIGVCVMKDSEIVSLCYSACVVDGLAEIDVITQNDFRGLGLAAVATQKFMSECMRRGIMPTWDCFLNNTASIKLANRLGFTQTITYPFYSFNIPLDFTRKN